MNVSTSSTSVGISKGKEQVSNDTSSLGLITAEVSCTEKEHVVVVVSSGPHTPLKHQGPLALKPYKAALEQLPRDAW